MEISKDRCGAYDVVAEAFIDYLNERNNLEMMRHDRPVSPRTLNNSECYDTAIAVLMKLRDKGIVGARFVSLAEELYPGIDPEELLKAKHGPLSGELHYLIEYKGRYYDAEVPCGVDSIYDVPMVKSTGKF
jgi:hypothetical protein